MTHSSSSKMHDGDTHLPLWRFEVGVENTDELTVGNGAICLYTHHNMFVRAPYDGAPIRNDRVWCRADEHIVVEPLEDDRFALKCWRYGRYFSCRSDGTLVQSSEIGKDEKFALYFDYRAEYVGLFSTEHKRWVTAEPDGRMSCNREHFGNWERFFGWKAGTKIAWSPADDWEKVAEYDNTQSAWAHEFEFTVKTGYVKAETPSAGLYIGKARLFPGPEMPEAFVSGIRTRTSTDWSRISAETWEEATESDQTATAQPSSYATVYQAVGKYGVFAFYSDQIRTVQSI